MRRLFLLMALLAAGVAVSCSDSKPSVQPMSTLPPAAAEPSPTVGASAQPSAEAALASYTNAVFKLELQYPANWVPDPQYAANIGGGIDEMYRDARGRESGFFQVNAVSAENQTLADVARGEVSHKLKPYGDNPTIETLTVSGREARLILPDEATAPEPFVAELVVPYTSPVFIAGSRYSFLIIYAHKDFIRAFADTLALTG
jgi:TolB protein